MPVVACGLVLWLFVRQSQANAKREDTLLTHVLHGRAGDGNGNPGTPGIAQLFESQDQLRREVSDWRRETREALAWTNERVTQVQECLGAVPCFQQDGEPECPREAS